MNEINNLSGWHCTCIAPWHSQFCGRSIMHISLKAALLAGVASLGLAAAAHAAPFTYNSQLGGAPSVPSVTVIDFDTVQPPNPLTFNTISGPAGIVQGSVGGQYAAPYLPGGPDATKYLTTGIGSVDLKFSALQ